jgi:hypothetical protein
VVTAWTVGWGALGSSGELWGALGNSGELWGALGSSGDLWGALGSSGELWGALELHLDREWLHFLRPKSLEFWTLRGQASKLEVMRRLRAGASDLKKPYTKHSKKN